MRPDLELCLGFADPGKKQEAAIPLSPAHVNSVSAWAGSYHIVDMRAHFRDYFETGGSLPLGSKSGFPPSHSYVPLGIKQKAGPVTGNAGEVAAAIFAHEVLDLNPGHIVHVRPAKQFSKFKAPDYMMRLDAGGKLRVHWSFSKISPWPVLPDWWPVEAKARSGSTTFAISAAEAFDQLIAYWHTAAHKAVSLGSVAKDVGFGMSVITNFLKPGTMRVQLFLPKDQSSLHAALVATPLNEPPLRAFFEPFIYHVYK